MKKILATVTREQYYRIMDGDQTILPRRKKPKELPGWVRVYLCVLGESGVQGCFDCYDAKPIMSIRNVEKKCCTPIEDIANETIHGFLWGWKISDPTRFANTRALSQYGFVTSPVHWSYVKEVQ